MLYGLSFVAAGGFGRGRGSDTAGDSPGTGVKANRPVAGSLVY